MKDREAGRWCCEGGGDSYRRQDLCGIGVAADDSPVPHDVHGQTIVHERWVAELFAVRDRAGLLRERITAILRALSHPRRSPACAPAASRERAFAPTQELFFCLAELSSRARCHERETSARQSDSQPLVSARTQLANRQKSQKFKSE